MNEELPKIYDKLNQEIKIGDFIIYGCALGRSAGLQMGKVVGFGQSKGYYNQGYYIKIYNESGKRVALQFPERVIVVTTIYNPFNPVKLHDSFNGENLPINWPKE